MKKKVNKKNLLLWVLMGVYALTLVIIHGVYYDFLQANKPIFGLLIGILGLLLFLCILSESKKIHGSTKINKKVLFSAVYFFIILILINLITRI
ncbi:hypothetical protein [Alkalihalobacillus sp. LMS39]|uniref:hypothetical protein n=1 Tax=Alkalihalobacillus sp. LMS39 TaxID=2924032 RepID=UPI001FB493DB|nr:hypothetical protein [Alkalihalobacillus sp. LMS39]UOE92254.1 hypothetical protein MM271_13395 [Alkalihalobacillus sp. LMS39]